MFRRLQTRLTVIYGAMIGLLLALIIAFVSVLTQNSARQQVEADLASTLSVFQRLWSLKEAQLHESAQTLSMDFGFRGAVATGDVPTIESALENLGRRLEVDAAFLILTDGKVLSFPGRPDTAELSTLINGSGNADRLSGVLRMDEQPFQAVAVPVRAPTVVGWLVFGEELSESYFAELARLSPIDVTVRLTTTRSVDSDRMSATISASALIDGFASQAPSRLELQYPLRKAMRPYRKILSILIGTSILGVIGLLVATWLISRSVTRPVAALDKATRQLAAGEAVDMPSSTKDEIGRLSNSFMDMAAEIREREAKIRSMAQSDVETGLPNRRALTDMLERLHTDPSEPSPCCVAVRIHRLSVIRTILGHAATYELVSEVGRRCEDGLDCYLVGQISSETLIIIVSNAHTDRIHSILSQLSSSFADPIQIQGERVDVDLTFGIATEDEHHQLNIIDRAGVAAMQARQSRALVKEFDAVAYGDPSGTLTMISSMLQGLDEGTIFLTYQPKIEMRTRRIDAYEVLIRWIHPERGFISPELFIRYAEETGHIRQVTEWVIRRAVEDWSDLRSRGMDLKPCINFSARLICDEEFIAKSIGLLGERAPNFCFEITETAVIDDPEVALRSINMLRAAGIEISIDDYGAGLSSLAYLRQIPAQELKIDKEFILDLDQNASDLLLVKSTIDLAHSLGMKVTAEGIESDATLQILAGMGADRGQGYHIGKPLRLPDFIDHVEQWNGALPIDEPIEDQLPTPIVRDVRG